MPNDREYRRGGQLDTKIKTDTVGVSGYAAVFNSETDIGGYFREKIAPGAFSDAIGRDDVVLLVNHKGLPLARTRSGTLSLEEDDRGLKIDSDLDLSDPDVQAVIPKMRRGDLNEMSFAFIADEESFSYDEENDLTTRTILRASLFDVAIVNYGAYNSTEIGLRSLEKFKTETSQNNAVIMARMRMNLAIRAR